MTKPASSETDHDWVEELRGLASHRVEETGLRAVGRDMGMAASGLLKFLAGAAPNAATRRKLLLWAKRQPGAPLLEVPTSEAEGILHDLVAPLSPAERARAANGLAEMIRDAYEAHQVPLPRWLKELLARPARRPAREPADGPEASTAPPRPGHDGTR